MNEDNQYKKYFKDFINECDKEDKYNIRENYMKEIMNMNKEIFIEKLKNNKLPMFVPSKKGDKDYIKLYRDTNFACGEEYAYNHRERLRSIPAKEYKNFINCFPEELNNYH